jgi:hypothetical protein
LRDDGTRESCHLETRSCLLHDLVHFAVETEAGLADAFFGRVARGVAYESLAHSLADRQGGAELLATEQVVGPLQSAWKAGKLDPHALAAQLRAYLQATGESCPSWVDGDLLARAAQRLRQLVGQWQSTRFGETLELRFQVPG